MKQAIGAELAWRSEGSEMIQAMWRFAILASVVVISSVSMGGEGSLSATATQAGNRLEQGFLNPPRPARPSTYWLWLNGYVNRDYVETELQAFADVGIGGVLIFDMGARGDQQVVPPAGPAFMSDPSVEMIAHSTRVAKRLGLDVQLAACSSWDLGGTWVPPEQASMALYHTQVQVRGPQSYNRQLPFPKLPAKAPRNTDGQPLFTKEVAVLAVPEEDRLPGHEFVFRLPRGDQHEIDHVVLYNAGSDSPQTTNQMQPFAKRFSVAVSVRKNRPEDFQRILLEELEPHTQPQRFNFPATDARFVRLRILSGYLPDFEQVQLGEFEVYSTAGKNVAASKAINRKVDAAQIVSYSSEAADDGNWTVGNLHDGAKSRPDGVWSFRGPPPLVIRDPSRIVNLSSQLDATGRLQWAVPKGDWTIMRFVCGNTGERLKVPSPNSDGLATDHFSHQATRAFIATLTERLERKLGNLNEAGIKQLYLPSYEVVNAKWTPGFLTAFQHYRQYDMTPYLPVLVGCQIKNAEHSQRFLYDLEKTLGDLLVDAYYRTASQVAHEAGLGIEAEAGGPGPPVHQVPVDALKALGAIDEMRGEFWPWRTERDALWVVKETASAAHIYGRRRVHMEAFTGFYHWENGPLELKSSADRAFCEGMNHVVWHTATHQPPEAGKPGWVYGAGTHLTPNLIWWPMAKPWIDYLSRCSFMLQQGLFVGDVCYYYGDQGANFVPPKHVDPSLGPGYDYDVVNREVILERMTVKDHKFVLPDGMQYEILVLPDREDIDLEVLEKIQVFLQQGGTVVGPQPTKSNGLTDYPHRDRQVKRLAELIWADCDGVSVFKRRYGRGNVICGQSLRDVLRERNVGPDFSFSSPRDDTQIDFIHRRTKEADIYFVRNLKSRPEQISATFRVRDKTPRIWNPDNGQIGDLHAYEATEEGTRVQLSLDPLGSLFVVFSEANGASRIKAHSPGLKVQHVTDQFADCRMEANGDYRITMTSGRSVDIQVDELPPPIHLDRAWNVAFLSGRGAPDSIQVQSLQSWTEFEEPGIKYYSGIARYQTTFDVPDSWLAEERRVRLDLGHLWAVGRVKLNGTDLGILWRPPFCLDVTDVLRPSGNELEIEVANSWSNRLVGDAHLPPEERFCQTNITGSGTPRRPWKSVPLRKSGLLGPVRLMPAVTRQVPLP